MKICAICKEEYSDERTCCPICGCPDDYPSGSVAEHSAGPVAEHSAGPVAEFSAGSAAGLFDKASAKTPPDSEDRVQEAQPSMKRGGIPAAVIIGIAAVAVIVLAIIIRFA